MNNDFDRENQLITAFAQLLEDTDDVIRGFAEDLVKYAYITSYDERGVNAFFHLVPLQYKMDHGYVRELKDVLSQFKDGTNVSGYTSVAQIGDDPQSMSFPSINLAIARNMWDDRNVVPQHILNLKPNSNDPFQMQTEASNRQYNNYDTVISKSVTTINGKSAVMYDVFATSVYDTTSEYVTVTTGVGLSSNTELYQLIGTVAYVDEEGKPLKRGAKNVYKRIPKLGIKQNGFRVNEFAKGGFDVSAFEQNAFEEYVLQDDNAIIEAAMVSVKLPKLKKGSDNFTKEFIPHLHADVQVQIRATEKQVTGDNTNVVDVDTSTNVDPLAVSQDQTEFEDANDFVNISINNDFDATPAMDQLQENLDIFANMQNDFADMSTPTQEAFDDGGFDMAALAELGKKRKKECE